MRRKIQTWLCLILPLWLAGCSTVESYPQPKVKLAQYQRVFVEASNNDSNNLDKLMVAELQRLGYEATSGARTMVPDDAQIRILYQGRWTWDFHTYLIQLEVTVRDAHSDKMLATGRHFHPGMTKKPPEQMIHELFGRMFGPHRG